MVEAYCIEEEGKFKRKSFNTIVPDVLREDKPDKLVLQAGSIEITNIDVEKALNDETKEIAEYKREWYLKAEESSEKLFSNAESAIGQNPDLNVVIVKRLPRFDAKSEDTLGIKSK